MSDFENILRDAFKYGSLNRILYCTPEEEEKFRDLVERIKVPHMGSEIEVVADNAIRFGWVFLVDPYSNNIHSADVCR